MSKGIEKVEREQQTVSQQHLKVKKDEFNGTVRAGT